MKKILFSMAVISATFLASCTKDSDSINQELTAPTKGSMVNLSFKTLDIQTRSALDDMGAAQAWEKKINHLDLFVFNSRGELITREQYNSDEVESGGDSFALPEVSSNDNVRFIAVGNFEFTDEVQSETEIVSLLSEHTSAENNGSYKEATNQAVRDGGFVFECTTDVTIAEPGKPNNVTINMDRLVSKFAIETSLSFANITESEFVGSVLVDNIEIVDDGVNSLMQKSSKIANNYYNLFYISPYDSTLEGTFKLRINIFYDKDGDLSTTDDQSTHTLEQTLDKTDFTEANKAYKYRFAIETTVNYGPDMSVNLVDWNITEIVNIEEDCYVDLD